jgi:hypothetical protein
LTTLIIFLGVYHCDAHSATSECAHRLDLVVRHRKDTLFGPVDCNREHAFDARRSGLSRCRWNRCAAAKVFCQCAITSACNIRVAAIWRANAPRRERGAEGLNLREPVPSRRICAIGPVIASIHATRAALQDAIRAMVPRQRYGDDDAGDCAIDYNSQSTTQACRRNQPGCAKSDGHSLRIPRALSSNRVTASRVRRQLASEGQPFISSPLSHRLRRESGRLALGVICSPVIARPICRATHLPCASPCRCYWT